MAAALAAKRSPYTCSCNTKYLEGALHEAAHSPFIIGALIEENCPSEAALAPPGVDTPRIGLGDPSHQGGRRQRPLDP